MRPHYLKMQAFGPYADTQELDFADLQGRTFFLIHGPTGAGKTSILDAMCFALYGESSGLRDGKSLRSDYAAANAQTEVIFTFAVGSDRYRVQRAPEQERTKKSGSGTTRMKGEAALWRVAEDGAETLLVAGYEKVTEKIKGLLGFEGAQFRQVVLLPQGEFRRLLLATSGERQSIMQALFKTDIYQRIEQKLSEKYNMLEERFRQFKLLRQNILAMAQIEDCGELETRLQTKQQAVELLAGKVQQAEQQVAQANAAVTAGELAQAVLDEQQLATAAVRELSEKTPVVAEKKHELVRAKQAATLLDVEHSAKQAAADVQSLQQAVARQAEQVQQAATQAESARAQLKLEQDRESERKHSEREVLRLQELEGKASALQAARQAATAALAAEQQINAAKDQAAATLQTIQQTIAAKALEREQALASAAQVVRWQGEAERLQQQTAKRITFEEVQQQQVLAVQQAETAELTLGDSEQQYQQTKLQLEELQAAWAAGQAVLMAARLQSGAACPVCGSLDHPAPAQGDQQIPDEQILKQQQSRLAQLEKQRLLAASDAAERRAQSGALTNRLNELSRELAGVVHITVAECRAQEAQAQAEYELARTAAAQAELLQGAMAELAAGEREGTAQLEQAIAAWQTAVSTCKATEAIAQERSAGIPLEVREPEALRQAQQQADRILQTLRQKLAQAELTAAQATEQLAKAAAMLESTRQNLKTAEARLETEQKRFAERIILAGFAGHEEYTAAQKPQDYLEKLEQRIEAFEQQLNAARERAGRAQQAAKDIIPPQLAVLRQTVVDLQLQFKETLAEREAKLGQLENDQKWLVELQKVDGDIAGINRVYPIAAQLHRAANGFNSQKITFQRYVLGALLDDVAQAANARFRVMSRGRYHLRRISEQEDKRKLGGLDLEVFDSYTGEARPVSTLSGGETFLASLSLALGLADVVQAYSGGIRIDTILVDEGFGSLDPETLDFALQALLDLQQGGRLVGIISHLPEVKQRIDARLEVLPSDRGSRAKFVVG